MGDIASVLAEVVGDEHVLTGEQIHEDYTRDEALNSAGVRPACVVKPADASQVAAIVKACAESSVPLTARGAGTGLSGACIPCPDGVLVSFERMSSILEIDTANNVAVVQ